LILPCFRATVDYATLHMQTVDQSRSRVLITIHCHNIVIKAMTAIPEMCRGLKWAFLVKV